MSAPQWKPGDVAMAVGESGDFMIVRTLGAGGPNYWSAPRGWPKSEPADPDARSLIVIDPEDREQVERLADAFGAASDPSVCWVDQMQAAIRSLVVDPKPEEPQGLGAVVEDDRGVLWVRSEKAKGIRNPWMATLSALEPDEIRQLAYADVAAVRVLSEGWSE